MKHNLIRRHTKTHKNSNAVELLTNGCNKATGKFSGCLKKFCASLTHNIEAKIKGTTNLLDIIYNLNTNRLPETRCLFRLKLLMKT